MFHLTVMQVKWANTRCFIIICIWPYIAFGLSEETSRGNCTLLALDRRALQSLQSPGLLLPDVA